jgi:hypothetical protein
VDGHLDFDQQLRKQTMNLFNDERSFIKAWALFAMLALLLSCSSLSRAQSTPQTITTTSASTPSGCASISVDGNKGAVGFHVGGTWTGTLQPEISIQGNAPSNVQVTPYSSSTAQSTVTANGDYYVNQVAGATVFYLCGPTSTGTANVYINSSTALNGGGAGGGGGAVSSVFGRTGAVVATTGDYTCAQVTGCTTTYSFFGNTMNPLTALVDPTTIIDAAGNSVAFTSTSGLALQDTAGDAISLFSGSAGFNDSLGDICNLAGGEFACGAGGSVTFYSGIGGIPIPTTNNAFVGAKTGSSVRDTLISYGGNAFRSSVAYGGAFGSATALTANTEIGSLNAYAYNGTSLNGPIAAFRTYAAQNQTTSAGGSYADVATTPNGSTTEAEVVRFENDGGITVPSTVTGGDKGAGTINASGLYVNGVAVNTSAAAVASVSNSDSTLTISPTTGAVVASLNLGHANTWTGAQTFNGTFGGTGVTTYLASPAAIGGTTAAAGTFTTLTGTTSVTAGVAGTTSGVLNLEGSTSGAATITAPAVAGTTSNLIIISNAIQLPNGNPSFPCTVGIGFPGLANSGMFYDTGSFRVAFCNNGSTSLEVGNAGIITGTQGIGMPGSAGATGTPDTYVNRQGAGVVGIGSTGTNATGTLDVGIIAATTSIASGGFTAVSIGTPTQVYNTAATSQTASIAATTMLANGASDRNYKFTIYIGQVAQGTTCTVAGSVAVNLVYTDPITGNAYTYVVPLDLSGGTALGASVPLSTSAPTVANVGSAVIRLRAKASTNVQYSTTYATGTCSSGQPSYSVFPDLEAL